MWRGTANWSKFGAGKHFVVAGSHDARLVVFPIAAGETDDTLLTNWVFVHRAAEDGSPLRGRDGWQERADRARCLRMLENFVIPDLDVHALASASENICESAMCDRNPLPRWSFGRVTLMGDAAHPMYPFGGNGAAQAVLDVRIRWPERLPRANADVTVAFHAYELQRREKVYAVVNSNRQGGPERVADFDLSRLSTDATLSGSRASFEERKADLQDIRRSQAIRMTRYAGRTVNRGSYGYKPDGAPGLFFVVCGASLIARPQDTRCGGYNDQAHRMRYVLVGCYSQ